MSTWEGFLYHIDLAAHRPMSFPTRVGGILETDGIVVIKG
jgi:hypothetical protein